MTRCTNIEHIILIPSILNHSIVLLNTQIYVNSQKYIQHCKVIYSSHQVASESMCHPKSLFQLPHTPISLPFILSERCVLPESCPLKQVSLFLALLSSFTSQTCVCPTECLSIEIATTNQIPERLTGGTDNRMYEKHMHTRVYPASG